MNHDCNNIRPMNGLAMDGFEEFVCQLAHKELTCFTKHRDSSTKVIWDKRLDMTYCSS